MFWVAIATTTIHDPLLAVGGTELGQPSDPPPAGTGTRRPTEGLRPFEVVGGLVDHHRTCAKLFSKAGALG